MPFSKHPLVSAAHVLLWALGLFVGYLAFLREKPAPSTTPSWRRAAAYITSIPATFVMLGLLFGFVYYPSVERSVVAGWVNILLMLTLFVMGVQITADDWKGILRHPKIVSVAVALRWICMPLLAYILANALLLRFLSQPAASTLAVGLVILGTTPTGAASNTLTLISRGDLALSVSVTTFNTLLAPFLQPFLITLFVGKVTRVDTFAIFLDLLEIVLVPVLAGSLIGWRWPGVVRKAKPALGAISVLCLCFIIMGNMSKGTATLLKQLWVLPLLAATCLIQGMAGLSLGYYAPKLFGFSHKQRVASCFEVGVENASLSMVIALKHFSPLAAIPAILYSKLQHMLAIGIFVSRFQRVAEDEGDGAVARPPAAQPERAVPVIAGGPTGGVAGHGGGA
jgi:BASS family bile acid:Na+ symporter